MLIITRQTSEAKYPRVDKSETIITGYDTTIVFGQASESLQ